MIAALGACITVSCNKEFEYPEVTAGQQGEAAPADELEEGSAVVFSAGFVDMEETTKTIIGAKEGDKYIPKWTTGEKIRINSIESSGTTLINGGEHANFTVEGVSAPYCALSPSGVWTGSLGSTWDAETKQLRIFVPGTGAPQKYRTNSGEPTYYAGSAVMAAYNATDTDLQFEHLMTYYKLTIGDGSHGANIKQIYVRQQGSTPEIAGVWEITYGDNISFKPINQTAIVSYSVEDAAGIAQGTPVIIALPAYNFANGLILTVKDVNGDFQSYSIPSSVTDFSDKRGVIITKELTFNPQSGVINNAADWEAFAAAVNGKNDWDLYRWVGNGTVKIGADFSAESLTQIIGKNGKFSYNIDGQGHTITQTDANHSLIRNIRGTVSDLKLAGTLNVTGMVSPLVDTLYAGGSITDVKNYMTINGVHGSSACSTSGLVLIATGGTISGCKNHGNITATVDCSSKSYNCQVGGIVCQINNLSENLLIENCTNYGTLTVTPTITGTTYSVGYAGLGGIVGWLRSKAHKVTLDNCDNEGALIWNKPDAAGNKCQTSVGGILGIAAPISTGANIYVISVPTDNNGMWIELKDCDNKGSVTCKALSNSSSTEARNKVYIGGIAGSLQGQSTKYAVIDNCQSTGTILGYDITSDDPYNDATASQRAAFSTVLGGISGWSAYIDVKNGTTVNCTIGSINRQVAAIGGAFGFTIRPFSISNSNIYYIGYFNRVYGFQSNRAVIAVVPVKYDNSNMYDNGGFKGPVVAGSSVTNCKYGATLHTNTKTFDYTTTTCLSENATIFTTPSQASDNMVVGHGFPNNTEITTSGNTFWNGN